ncbi:MAG: hypothetical protein O7E49_02855, partial [Gemmatimonadetes bacterium]|nr:hypothetical protein [Gemmatimonadota bacterium]
MSWLRRLPSVVVFTGRAGLLAVACNDPGAVLQFQTITVDLAAAGPGAVQATDPGTGQVKSASFSFQDAGLGGSIDVTAVPDAGGVLQSWTSGCPGSTATVCSISFSGGRDVTIGASATFVPDISGITFSDNFDSNCGNWTVTASGGTAGGTNIEACRSSGGISSSGYREMEHQLGMGSMSVEHTFTGNNLVVGRGTGET